ncbi:Ig-like domain-containing protein [Desulfotomaculum copahuensis]|uniref:SLH domain-containing protein n=1 Tax=Desulfotomaculum copahuensis TaxID=1838280 RepID=A0A1B7LDS8_9FIRM|nr:Ig-like domain-containing protein [Desulfotomaculum copahuensis]OAT81257.1 hypothetical protein A6M21_00205 [Desulfotomaculum copahuensis]
MYRLRRMVMVLGLLCLGLTLLAGTALAAPGHGKEKQHQRGPAMPPAVQANGQNNVRIMPVQFNKAVHPVRAAAESKFKDVKGHWGQDAISAMSRPGLIRGYSDDTFRPDATVTKDEAVTMLVRMLGLENQRAQKALTPAVAKNCPAWARNNLALAVEHGIVTPAELTSFSGQAPAERYQVAAWMARAAGLNTGKTVNLPFRDDTAIPAAYRAYVQAMYQNSIMSGYPGDLFLPDQPIRRAEMASLMLRLMVQCPVNPQYLLVQGTVKQVDDHSITLTVAPYRIHPMSVAWRDWWGKTRTQTYALADDVVAFANGKSVSPADVAAGSHAVLVLNSEAKVIVILAGGGSVQPPPDNGSALRVESLSPANGATGVDTGIASLQAVFNENIYPVDANALVTGITVENVNSGIDVPIQGITTSGGTLTVQLNAALDGGQKYQVLMPDGLIKDADGRQFAGFKSGDWVFTTRGQTAPVVQSLSPANGDENVPAGLKTLTAVFSGDVHAVGQLSDLAAGIQVKNTTDNQLVPLDGVAPVSILGDTLMIRLKDGLTDQKDYQVTINGNLLADAAGNKFAGIAGGGWTFGTR